MNYIFRCVFITIVLMLLTQLVSLADNMHISNILNLRLKMLDSNYLSQATENKTPIPDPQSISGNELEELNESSITTKIYRSNDPALDLIENDSEVNTTSFSDLINKDELIKKKGSKIVERKIIKNEVRSHVGFIQQLKRLLMPWFITLLLGVGLALIFKYVVKKA